MQPGELVRRFTYHPPTDPEVRERHDQVRALTLAYARDVSALLPEGREESLFVTGLEQASFWAHAAIAREGK